LRAELQENFPDIEVEFIESGGGVFEVVRDGKLIFSKKKLNRFPETGEVSKLIK
jgi:selT/selW/selH-like putative selenoprotein